MANYKKQFENCWTIQMLATLYGVGTATMRIALCRPEFERYRIPGLAKPYRYSDDPVFLRKLYEYLKRRYKNVSLNITPTGICRQEESNIEFKQLS